MQPGRLREWVRFTDAAFDKGTECVVATGAHRVEILRAMRAEFYTPGAVADAFFDGLCDRVGDGDLEVIKIANKWRFVSSAKIERST